MAHLENLNAGPIPGTQNPIGSMPGGIQSAFDFESGDPPAGNAMAPTS